VRQNRQVHSLEREESRLPSFRERKSSSSLRERISTQNPKTLGFVCLFLRHSWEFKKGFLNFPLLFWRFKKCSQVLPFVLECSRTVLEHSRLVDKVPVFTWEEVKEASTWASAKLLVWITGRGRTLGVDFSIRKFIRTDWNLVNIFL